MYVKHGSSEELVEVSPSVWGHPEDQSTGPHPITPNSLSPADRARRAVAAGVAAATAGAALLLFTPGTKPEEQPSSTVQQGGGTGSPVRPDLFRPANSEPQFFGPQGK